MLLLIGFRVSDQSMILYTLVIIESEAHCAARSIQAEGNIIKSASQVLSAAREGQSFREMSLMSGKCFFFSIKQLSNDKSHSDGTRL